MNHTTREAGRPEHDGEAPRPRSNAITGGTGSGRARRFDRRPNTLQPVPPNATCTDDGPQIICDTFVDDYAVNDPIPDVDLPCGTIYETNHYHGAGTRW